MVTCRSATCPFLWRGHDLDATVAAIVQRSTVELVVLHYPSFPGAVCTLPWNFTSFGHAVVWPCCVVCGAGEVY